MIPKVSRGTDMGGLVCYLVGPGRGNEHTGPHLVAGTGRVMRDWGGRQLGVEDGRPIGKQVDRDRAVHRTDVPGGHVWHCSLSLRADEGRLSDEQWARIAAEVVEGMGFDGPDADQPCRWAAIRHGQSEAGNDHIHLAVSLVRRDGSPANVFRDYRRVQKLCREAEVRHGLARVGGPVSQRGLSRADVERSRRGEEPLRWRLERTVRAVAAQAGSESQFVRGLRSAGLLVRPHWAKGGRNAVNGYAVALRPRRGERGAVWFGGGQLATDLSLPRLRMAHRDTWGSEAVGVSIRAWIGRRDRREQDAEQRPARATVQVTDERVAGYAAEYERLREQLRQVAPGDMATWSVTAHELAGVLSAWSLAAEGSRPGPLAEAARQMARSAQVPAHVAARSGPVPSLRGSSLILASAAVGGRGPVGQAVLLRQIVSTARMVHDAHAAEQRAAEAMRIAALADRQFAAVRDRLPSAALGKLVAEQARQQAAQRQAPARPVERTEVAR